MRPPPTLSIKCLHPLPAMCGVAGSQPLDRCPPPPPHSGQHLKESKLSFPPTWPVYWLLSGEQPDPHTLLSVTVSPHTPAPVVLDDSSLVLPPLFPYLALVKLNHGYLESGESCCLSTSPHGARHIALSCDQW